MAAARWVWMGKYWKLFCFFLFSAAGVDLQCFLANGETSHRLELIKCSFLLSFASARAPSGLPSIADGKFTISRLSEKQKHKTILCQPRVRGHHVEKVPFHVENFFFSFVECVIRPANNRDFAHNSSVVVGVVCLYGLPPKHNSSERVSIRSFNFGQRNGKTKAKRPSSAPRTERIIFQKICITCCAFNRLRWTVLPASHVADSESS